MSSPVHHRGCATARMTMAVPDNSALITVAWLGVIPRVETAAAT